MPTNLSSQSNTYIYSWVTIILVSCNTLPPRLCDPDLPPSHSVSCLRLLCFLMIDLLIATHTIVTVPVIAA